VRLGGDGLLAVLRLSVRELSVGIGEGLVGVVGILEGAWCEWGYFGWECMFPAVSWYEKCGMLIWLFSRPLVFWDLMWVSVSLERCCLALSYPPLWWG